MPATLYLLWILKVPVLYMEVPHSLAASAVEQCLGAHKHPRGLNIWLAD